MKILQFYKTQIKTIQHIANMCTWAHVHISKRLESECSYLYFFGSPLPTRYSLSISPGQSCLCLFSLTPPQCPSPLPPGIENKPNPSFWSCSLWWTVSHTSHAPPPPPFPPPPLLKPELIPLRSLSKRRKESAWKDNYLGSRNTWGRRIRLCLSWKSNRKT